MTEEKGANNLAFATLFQLGDAGACVDLLVKTKRAPEAALFARTYAPRFVPHQHSRDLANLLMHSHVPKVVDAWRDDLKSRPKIAAGIAHPVENADLFTEGWEGALEREQHAAPTAGL